MQNLPSHVTCGIRDCMKEYFTMTAHWIEICGCELSSQWVFCQRVLGAFPVQDASIDHQGECQNMLNIQKLYPLMVNQFYFLWQ